MKFVDTPLALYAKRLIALKGQEDRIFKLALDNKFIKDLIIFLNTDNQLGQEHTDSLGQKLFNTLTDRTTYSLFDPKGRGGQEYTLNDTGAFWDSWIVIVQQGNIVIDANPNKDDDNLFDIYGTDIVGLTKENLDILIREALEQFITYYRRNLLPK